MSDSPKPYVVTYKLGPTVGYEHVDAYNVSDAMMQAAVRWSAKNISPNVQDVAPDREALAKQQETERAAWTADFSKALAGITGVKKP